MNGLTYTTNSKSLLNQKIGNDQRIQRFRWSVDGSKFVQILWFQFILYLINPQVMKNILKVCE